MRPSQFPEWQNYPALKGFVANHLDMQFDDIRTLMKLPKPRVGLNAGCNFAAAALLCNLISGISEFLYTPIGQKAGSGTKFQELLKRFYPWEHGEGDEVKSTKSEFIYTIVRNPLSHSLAVLKKGSLRTDIKKDALTETRLRNIEKSNVRPNWVPVAVTADTTKREVSVIGLYWGVFHLFWAFAKDTQQMQQAEKRILKKLKI